ncbi:MAG: indolepyruvate ferredoxin oxidoreductase subunit alpha [Thermodesulfobacteriota bacterium]
MSKIFTPEQSFLLGNEAIARGAIEANVAFVAGYPGTPSSEILETVAESARKYDIHVEWSTNEMVAFENALGASLVGRRAMVTMKHAGLNWVADPLSVAVYSGIRGGLVIVAADDPGCHSSANEQDSRFYGLFFNILTLEPSDPQNAKDMIKEAFALSEASQLPVLFRSVTRVGHSRANVTIGNDPPPKTYEEYRREPGRFFVTGRLALKRHVWQIEQQAVLRELSDRWRMNELSGPKGDTPCLITAGAAATYVNEFLRRSGASQVAVLKLGSVYPLPRTLVQEALKDKTRVLILEEGAPFLELQVKALASEWPEKPTIWGKMSGALPQAGELTPDIVSGCLARFLEGDEPGAASERVSAKPGGLLPPRTMVFCAGCPHTGTMYALKEACSHLVISPFILGDIGCYTLMCYAPHELGDAKFSMGASISVAAGMAKATGQKSVAVVGDSTFIHAGLPGLINCVYNRSNVLVVICDNGTTGMTGGQPHAGTGRTAAGAAADRVVLRDLVRGCGVEFIRETDPYDLEGTRKAFREALDHQGVSVVIAERECALTRARGVAESRERPPVYAVDPDECVGCGECLQKLACPAMQLSNDEVRIEAADCRGCGLCAQVCPAGAIVVA